MSFLSNWNFDPITALVTVIVVPLLVFLSRILLKHLKDWSEYALEGILYRLSYRFKHSMAAAFSLRRYASLQLRGPNKFLHVPASVEITLETDTLYVPLTLEQQGAQQVSYTHNHLLMVGDRIRVVGDPGSGKSSLIKKLLRDACSSAIARPSKARLPVMFELKELKPPDGVPTEELGTWFYSELRSQVDKTAVYEMGECFDNYARTTGVLILLDGLDEVSTSCYLKAQQSINGLSRKLGQLGPNNIIVLTMRIQFHQQVKNEYQDQFPHVMLLKPFSPSDVYEFLSRWPFKKDKNLNVSRIYNELTDRPTLREMCSNPLILAMYVAEDQISGSVVAPETRTEFYAEVTKELLVRRRSRQIGAPIQQTQLKEQRERILGRLAYEHLLDPDQAVNSLKWSEGIRVTGELVGGGVKAAERIFTQIAIETGIIAEEKPQESFRFIHLTFCEFLAAYEAVQGKREGWSTLVTTHKQLQASTQRYLKSRLIEVLPFAAGLLPRVQRPDALSDLARIGDGQLLARTFLETKLYDHPTWRAFVESEHQALLAEPEENWDDEWLRRLHLFNVVVKDAEYSTAHVCTNQAAVDLEGFFHNLVGRQQQSLSKVLSAYASQDAAAAFRLAEILNFNLAEKFPEIVVTNCDQRPFFASVWDRALEDLDQVGLWSTLLAESSLRNGVVAEWASEIEPPRGWTRLVAELPKQQRWYHARLFPRSFLTDCLSIALGPRGCSDARWCMLNSLRLIPAPGSVGFVNYYGVALSIFASIITCSLAVAAFLTTTNYWVIFLLSFVGLVLIAVSYFMLTRCIGLKRVYGLILHPPPLKDSIYLITLARDMRDVASIKYVHASDIARISRDILGLSLSDSFTVSPKLKIWAVFFHIMQRFGPDNFYVSMIDDLTLPKQTTMKASNPKA